MKVLIVKTSALGDIVHSLPVLPYLQSALAGMEIDWLAEERFAPLLEGHPAIRKVHRVRTKEWRRNWMEAGRRELPDLVRQLRREGYDAVLDLQGNSKSALFALVSGAPLRFGFDRRGVREWPNLLATNRRVPLSNDDFHITERSLAIARRAFPGGEGGPLAGPLCAAAEALEAVDSDLKGFGARRKRVVIHYGTSWKTKLWPVESWGELASRLYDELGLLPVLTWGSEEEREVAWAIRNLSGNRANLWPRRGTLAEIVALLSRADLVIGGDTGPVHIAAAVGTSTVSLFRVTDPWRNGPRGPEHIRLKSPLGCSPCLRKDCPQDRECARSISVDSVFSAVRSILQRKDLK